MKRGQAIIPWGLLLILLTAGTVFASETACPTPHATPPRLFLQTDHLKTSSPAGRTDNPAGPKGYQLDAALIGSATASDAAKTDNAPVALATEKDLTALHLKTDSAITPYVGAGVTTGPEAEESPGLSSFEAEREAERQAYLLGAGVGCDLSKSARLNLGYRYAAGNLPELSGTKPSTTEPESDDHHISFGLKLDF